MDLEFLHKLHASLEDALAGFEEPREVDYRHEFARRLNLRTWERDAVKRLVNESYVTGEVRKLGAPIYDARYARHPEEFHGAMARSQTRADRIFRRFVTPKVASRRRDLEEYVTRKGWRKS